MTLLTPLLVRTFGRTGSTLLMQILATSDRVRFEREYPFEHRYLSYAYNLARLVRAPVEDRAAWNNDVLFRNQSPLVGGLPYGKIKSFDVEWLSRELFVSTWEQFSRAMRRSAGLADDVPAWYAEKAPHQVADLANELLGGRNVFLLRDPRDEMVSIKSFNAKRGFASFGWVESDTDDSYARKLCKNRRNFMHRLMELTTDERRIAVRYEDLIRDGEAQTRRLAEWLGTELDYRAATQDRGIQKVHMTSKNPAGSVERWRDELDPSVQRIFADELGDELSALGYPLR